jgi:hypothetical protein
VEQELRGLQTRAVVVVVVVMVVAQVVQEVAVS